MFLSFKLEVWNTCVMTDMASPTSQDLSEVTEDARCCFVPRGRLSFLQPASVVHDDAKADIQCLYEFYLLLLFLGCRTECRLANTAVDTCRRDSVGSSSRWGLDDILSKPFNLRATRLGHSQLWGLPKWRDRQSSTANSATGLSVCLSVSLSISISLSLLLNHSHIFTRCSCAWQSVNTALK
jgi:hypothetical protein